MIEEYTPNGQLTDFTDDGWVVSDRESWVGNTQPVRSTVEQWLQHQGCTYPNPVIVEDAEGYVIVAVFPDWDSARMWVRLQ